MDGSIILQRLGQRKRVLLLQGPCGTFFNRLSKFLTRNGCEVSKVNFNPGDELFYRQKNALSFREEPEQWSHWVRTLMVTRNVEVIVLFGDCRRHHIEAAACAKTLGIGVLVFEEGYIRPGFVTLEANGVNAKSEIPALFEDQRPDRVPMLPAKSAPIRMPEVSEGQRLLDFASMCLQTSVYTAAMCLFRNKFPHYQHHKHLTICHESLCGLLSVWRKPSYRLQDAPHRYRLTHGLSGKFFAAPLQVHNDSQLTHLSDFTGQEDFIEKVVKSFAANADPQHHLVFKHHPMDRGHRHYGGLISQLANRYGLKNRIIYIHDIRLALLFRHTLGVVTVNSTSGLSALYHGAPVICLGRALYDLQGLTYQGDMNSFWQDPAPPQATEVLRLRSLIRDNALVAGSFYAGKIHTKALAPAAVNSVPKHTASQL